MRLRSSELSNSEKPESDSCMENHEAVDEIMAAVDNSADDLKVGVCKGEKNVMFEDEEIVDDILMSSGSKVMVSIETLITSNPEKEIAKKEIECVTVGINEELKSSVPNSPNKLVVECENRSDDVETKIIFEEDADIKIVNGDEDKKPSLDDSETNRDFNILKEKMKIEEITEANNDSDAINENAKGVLEVKKGKRGRKRKVLESSGDITPINEKVEVKVNRRVLRSNTMTVNHSVKVDESRLNESVVGFKKQMEAECLGQTQFEKEVNEKSKLSGRPQKKQKRRARPPKIQGETGSKRKIVIQSVSLDENALQKEADEKQEKKQKRVLHKVTVIDNPKRRGRPPKGQKGNLSTPITNEEKQKTNNQLKGKNVKDSPKIHNVQKEAESPEDDNKPKINTFDDQSQTTVEETERSQTTKQLVRDKISSMIIKAGWVIELRKRQNKEYLDAVYVDQKGKTHWSVTKAYFSLLKKIEKGVANNEEISAFTPIPNEELSILFRSVSKVRSDKNMKKEKIKKGKNKAEIIITGVEQLKEHKRKSIKKSKVKPRLVARTTNKVPDQENADCTLFDGKRNLLSWMIDTGVIMPGGKLQYGESRGTVTRDGINCDCCNEIMDISSFVKHCGGKNNEGFENIYLESGSSFSKCLLESWRKEENCGKIRFNDVDISGDDPNDDTCNICGDGGDLICCDGCPSTFHQSCLDIQDFPSGDWRCIYCCCKFCGLVEDTAEILTCCLCEEKFHHLCLQEEVDSSSLAFCGKKCHEIHEQVQKYTGVKFELEDGFSWSLVKRCDVSQVLAVIDDQLKIECNSKLAVAFSVMDECFVPIMDERSGVNVIHNVVYNCGSNLRRLDYSGFFTAILERGGELISVASIRIHGHRVAEMPFIGTRNMYRRQGMCGRLLDAIEGALSCIGVKELVIPAIPELFKTWTKVFGFKPLEESKRREMKGMSMIVFPGTDMLQKPLLNNQFPVPDDKTVEHMVMNDDNALKSPSENSVVKTSPLTSPKISIDLNIQPASIDDDSISRDPQVCRDAFDNGTQPLVLV